MTKSERGVFLQSRRYNSKINDSILPVFEIIRDFIHVHSICSFLEDPIKTEQVTLMKKTQSKRRNSKINDPVWPVFLLVRDFTHVHIISKCQEDLNKTKRVMLMAKSNKVLFRNQGDITTRLMI